MKKYLIPILILSLAIVEFAWGAYSATWNSSYEASPADGDNISEGAQRIRNLKRDIRERMEKDHYMDTAGTDADHGEHKQSTYRTGAFTCTGAADKGVVYVKDVGGKAELFYCDEDSNEVQITSGGSTETFASGTTIMVFDAACPAGWTKETTTDDAAARVVSSSGGGTGGTTDLSTLAHLHTGPAHTHTLGGSGASTLNSTSYPNFPIMKAIGQLYPTTALTGGSGQAVSTTTDSGGTGNTSSTSISPKYIDGILCTKD